MRYPAIICGRVIGTYDGFDEFEFCDIVLMDFEPDYTVGLPSGELNINFNKGLFLQRDRDGNVTFEADIIETLHPIIRAPNDLA